MIIADTSVWIDYLKGSDYVKTDFEQLLHKRKLLAISPVFGELLQGAKNSREVNIIMGFWINLPKISEEALFVKAGNLSRKHKLFARGIGLIDCFLLAAGIQGNFGIWTLDKKLNKLIVSLSN
jgi:predicted nucleic acid-binding protein